MSAAELERQLFPPSSVVPSEQRRLPDWAMIHAELRRPGVTLALFWQECRVAHPQVHQCSGFYDR